MLVEARIAEAIRRGDLDDLPGQGEPLHLDDDTLVPVALRAAYRVLRNAGFVPPEVEIRREIKQVEDLLMTVAGAAERTAVVKRLDFLANRLALSRAGRGDLRTQRCYLPKLCARLQRS